MATSVSAAFDQYFDAINLAGDFRTTANTRRDLIVNELAKTFTILEAFATGSIPKFTALRGAADIDVMVALHYQKHIQDKTPTQVLASVRTALAAWRPGARRNGQAVTLKYQTWPDADVVPVARFVDAAGNFTHFAVPDSNTDTWIPSKPKELAATIEAKASSCGPLFRKLIKMLKHWNRSHGDYLRSYHIEVLAIRAMDGPQSEITWAMFKFFENARTLLAGSLYYDLGFADDYLTYADRMEVLKRFDTAIGIARTAWYSTYGVNSDHKEAIRLWRQIFGDTFPTYG